MIMMINVHCAVTDFEKKNSGFDYFNQRLVSSLTRLVHWEERKDSRRRLYSNVGIRIF